MLMAWNEGDEEALKNLIPIVYPELRRIARKHLAHRSPQHTLESGALVNEVYLKLVRAHGLSCRNREHFFAVCAQMIRHILVDHIRHHQYAKRGGGAEQISIDPSLLGIRAPAVEILELDEALTVLSDVDARKARVVELRFFGGLSVEETAKALEISQETVMRDWRFAKAWLTQRMRPVP